MGVHVPDSFLAGFTPRTEAFALLPASAFPGVADAPQPSSRQLGVVETDADGAELQGVQHHPESLEP